MKKWVTKFRQSLMNPQIRGAVYAVFGFVVFVLALLIFHRPVKRDVSEKKIVQMDFEKIERKLKAPITKPKPPEPKSNPKRQLRPQLKLAFQAGGLDLGLSLSDLNSSSSRLLSQSGSEVMTEDVVDRPPQVTYRSPMKYPPEALSKKLEGFVTVYLLVTQAGLVEKVKLLEANPTGVFEDAALEAVREWQFEPAEFQGRQVAVWVKQKINFKVN